MDIPMVLEQIAADARRTAAALLAAPDAPVPSCPGWSVTDLVNHHGDVHRWAAAIVESGEPQRTDFVGPPGVDDLAAWYLAGADRLVDVLTATDPDRDCWTFGDPPHRVRFWLRRQALEAAVHRWDAQRAAGEPDGFATALAADGVAEVVELFFPRQLRLERTPELSAPIDLHAVDLGRRWRIPADGDEPAAEIAAPADTLLLLLWRRADLDDPAVTFTGPDALEAEVRAARFAP